MEKQLVLKCPTGFEIICKKDPEKEKYRCCCCARPESKTSEADARSDYSI
jgi:hypothetical protein